MEVNFKRYVRVKRRRKAKFEEELPSPPPSVPPWSDDGTPINDEDPSLSKETPIPINGSPAEKTPSPRPENIDRPDVVDQATSPHTKIVKKKPPSKHNHLKPSDNSFPERRPSIAEDPDDVMFWRSSWQDKTMGGVEVNGLLAQTTRHKKIEERGRQCEIHPECMDPDCLRGKQ